LKGRPAGFSEWMMWRCSEPSCGGLLGRLVAPHHAPRTVTCPACGDRARLVAGPKPPRFFGALLLSRDRRVEVGR
jgi:hypothetical protein